MKSFLFIFSILLIILLNPFKILLVKSFKFHIINYLSVPPDNKISLSKKIFKIGPRCPYRLLIISKF